LFFTGNNENVSDMDKTSWYRPIMRVILRFELGLLNV